MMWKIFMFNDNFYQQFYEAGIVKIGDDLFDKEGK